MIQASVLKPLHCWPFHVAFALLLGGAGDLVSKVISRVINEVTPFRVLITLLITYLLSPLPLQVVP